MGFELLEPPALSARLAALALKTKGYLDAEEGLALYRLAYTAASLQLGPLVEIGSYCGKSTIYLASGAQHFCAPLICVDHHQGSEEMQKGFEHHDEELEDPQTGLLESLPLWRQTVKEAGFENVVGLVGLSKTVASFWSSPISLLFIDGGHSRKNAWGDYLFWSRFLAAEGFLVIHDVFEKEEEGGAPPYEIYSHALLTGNFEEILRVKSLRALVRVFKRS